MTESSGSSDLWNLTLQHSPIGMALVAPDGRLLMANPALAGMLGYDVDELTSRGFQEITHPEDLAADLGLVARTLEGEIDSFRLRKRYLHAQGQVIWGDLSAALVRSRDGTPLHFISQILDVTDQHQQEERLRRANADLERERQALEAIFETVGVGLLLIGPDGRYERMNRRHEETMRLPFPDGHDGHAGQLGHVYGLDGTTPLTKEEMPSQRAAMGEEFDDYAYWAGEDPLTRTAFSTSARQLRSASGQRLGAALAYQDITDLMRAIQVKDQFVASVSHELRTPLTSVLGYLEILGSRNDLPAQVVRQLRVVQRNALRLEALVTDLLHVGQADEGSLPLRRGPADLASLTRHAVEAVAAVAEEAGVSLEVDVPDRLDTVVDEQRMRQVVDNLLSNAVKYTLRDGSVTVALSEDDGTVRLTVSDTGIGIARDEVDQVFDRFFRGHEARDRHIPGTGLGLDIVSSIVAAHDGEVTLESRLGTGSTFRVSLPLTKG
ncbi:ATP-binding protein [Nocardioides sp. cx-169]|uniref:sensor histidine kinase n=1 Tax=Nocardioides sp. cx-169 TaxID=2899080 RepID=UPI001E2F5C34|nr:ATP-binding protein [Nocardioides sp. cx-169]MCD4533323.1 ATP-binding protein [Nocardioides sp. cx-169]